MSIKCGSGPKIYRWGFLWRNLEKIELNCRHLSFWTCYILACRAQNHLIFRLRCSCRRNIIFSSSLMSFFETFFCGRSWNSSLYVYFTFTLEEFWPIYIASIVKPQRGLFFLKKHFLTWYQMSDSLRFGTKPWNCSIMTNFFWTEHLITSEFTNQVSAILENFPLQAIAV